MGKNSQQQSSEGFTLIELSIVILIVGILVIPLMSFYQQNIELQKIKTTKDNINSVMSTVQVLGRYVCPADRALDESNPNYGVENCVMASIKLCSDPTKTGICKFQTTVDRDGINGNDFVIIGGVPLKYYLGYNAATLLPTGTATAINGANSKTIVDAWGNKLTYAVPALLSVPPMRADTFSDFKLGAITAIDEFGNNTSGVNNDGQFAIISHGPNASGAYNRSGILTPCPGATRETENCNDDSTFRQALGSYDAAGVTQYDDYARFYTISAGDLWKNIVNVGVTTPHLINANTQNVGVNITGTPSTKLQVGGTINADTIRTDSICGPNVGTSDCFSPTIVNAMPATDGTNNYSTGYCGNGQIVTEVSAGKLKCGYPTFKASGALDAFGVPGALPNAAPRCDTGKYIISILTNGCIYCNDGIKKCS